MYYLHDTFSKISLQSLKKSLKINKNVLKLKTN